MATKALNQWETAFASAFVEFAPLTINMRAIPELESQVQFHPSRKWQADFRFGNVLIEIEGAIWVKGRHTRGSGFLGDIEKYNAAAELGYVILRYPANLIKLYKETGRATPEGKRTIEEWTRQIIATWSKHGEIYPDAMPQRPPVVSQKTRSNRVAAVVSKSKKPKEID